MAHLTEEQNQRLREAMLAVIAERYNGVRKRLADAMGIAAPSLVDFLNGKGGASQQTADLFAERIVKKPTVDVIGRRALPKNPPKPEQGFPIPVDVRRRATVLLRQKPQEFSDEAIDIGFDSVIIRNADDAQNPSVVAEFVRLAILGTAARLPKVPPSSSPPAGTRRSRRRVG